MTTIFGRYKLGDLIGSGSFGQVYEGVSIRSKTKVAIKVDDMYGDETTLTHEAKLLNYLRGPNYIPVLRYYGTNPDTNTTYLVMNLLGKSLEDVKQEEGIIGEKDAIDVGLQCLEILKYVHGKSIIHRDIKPENFLFGTGNNSKSLNIIDFGLSKLYLKNDEHIECREGKKMTGTVRYISINIHNGLEPSRRDDLISLGYILIYFLKGRLPWQGLHALTREDKYSKIKNVKKHTSVDDLCEGLPKEFNYYLNYCYDLDFTNTPNYDILTTYLIDMYTNLYSNSSKTLYDWDISSNESIMEVNLESL